MSNLRESKQSGEKGVVAISLDIMNLENTVTCIVLIANSSNGAKDLIERRRFLLPAFVVRGANIER